MKQYQKIYLLLFVIFTLCYEDTSAQPGNACNDALPVPVSPQAKLDVAFNGEDVRWLTIQIDTPRVELEFTPDAISEFANIESIEVYSGADCNSKVMLRSQKYVDTDSLQIDQSIHIYLEEAGVNYFLKVNRLHGYGDGFRVIAAKPDVMGACSPVCPNMISNPEFSIYDASCLNIANQHQCPDPFNQGCICGWRATHGTPQLTNNSATMGVSNNDGEGIYQSLFTNVSAGRNYLLSFDYIRYSSSTSININVQLSNANYSPGPCFSPIPTADWAVPNTPVWASSTQWHTDARCFTSNGNYNKIRFYPTTSMATKEWVGVDNVILIELDTPIPDQTITCNETAILSQPCPSSDPRIHYLWSTGETTGSISVSPIVTTTYILTVTLVIANQPLCSYNIPATVYVNPLPTPFLAIGSNNICQLNATEVYCFNVPGALGFNYSINPANLFFNNGPCVDVTWNNLPTGCATIEVEAFANACTTSQSFDICLLCQGNPSNLTFCDGLASDILNDPQYASYISGGHIFTVPSGQWATFHGTFTIDVPFSFENSDVRFGPQAKVVVNPGQTFEVFNHSHLHSCDGVNMWESIWVKDPSGKVYIHDGGNIIEDAEVAVRSENGGNFEINSTTFKNNLIGVGAMYYQGVHAGKVYGCTFTGTGTMLNLPYIWCSDYPQCGIRIHDVKKIQLGEPNFYNSYGRNDFSTMLSGIYSSISNVDIYTSSFHDMIDPPGNCSPSEGCGIYAYGDPGRSTRVDIGNQAVSEQCFFNSCTYGIRERLDVHGEIRYNTITNCENAIANFFCNRNHNLVKGNTIDNFKRGIYFMNAINSLEFGLEIYENLFNTTMTSFNLYTYGQEAINVTNTFSAQTNLWVVGNLINYSRVGILARNVWEPCNIRSNTINFDILPADASIMGVHHGILCENDNGLSVDNNIIRWRNQPSMPTGFINKMNGISVNYGSNTSAISGGIHENKIGPYPAVNTGTTYGMGSGINLSSDCTGLQMYCNKMSWCEEGITLNHATVGQQAFTDDWINWYSNGNTFKYTPRQNGIYRVGGTAMQPISWAYVNADEDPHAFQINTINPVSTTFSFYACLPPAPMVEEEREDKYGFLVSNDELPLNPDYSGYEEQLKYSAKEKFYAAVKVDSTLLDAGVSEDAAYQNLYDALENSNIAKIQDIKTSIDSLEYAEASQKLSQVTDPNFIEQNKKTVMGVYLETFANDIDLDSAHRALLEPISVLHPIIGGEGVFWACAMLDKQVNNVLPPLRKANPFSHTFSAETTNLHVFPNPVKDELQVNYHTEVPLTLSITDITGKLILYKDLDSKNEIEKINTSSFEAGSYLLQTMNGNEILFTEKIIVIK